MKKLIKAIEEFRYKAFMLTSQEVYLGNKKEFSYMTFYDKEKGVFSDPILNDSFNDSATTTTATFSPEDTMIILDKLEENPDLIYVWCHSHVGMAVTPSAQDISTIRENELEMAIITNNKGEINVLINNEGDMYEIKHYTRVTNATSGNTVRGNSNGVQHESNYDSYDGYRSHYGIDI